MQPPPDPAADARALESLGYRQELLRRLGGFSNTAVSLSIICILAGGVTSFHLGLCGVGGAAVGLGWPLVTAFALCVAAAMAQVASAFPTAGGLYHWAAVLGGRGWGWVTGWFNLAGLVTVLAAINVGTYQFAVSAFGVAVPAERAYAVQAAAVALVTFSQAWLNHRGIRTVRVLTDFSGYWILAVSAALALALLGCSPHTAPERLLEFANFSGYPVDGPPVYAKTDNVVVLFLLGLLWPAYTLTGYDASAHVAEETVDAARAVPAGIVRSVLVSGVAGFGLLAVVVMTVPPLPAVANLGEGAFAGGVRNVLPEGLSPWLFGGIVVAQYLCGLATVTSASRMAYAFARDGSGPLSRWLRAVSPAHRVPDRAVWTVAAAAVTFTLYTPVYSTITSVCAILLYVSYVLPTALGLRAYRRTWTHFGPWTLGRCYRPLAAVAVAGCVGLVVIGVLPPNEKAGVVLLGFLALLAVGWFGFSRTRFPGPPARPLAAEGESLPGGGRVLES